MVLSYINFLESMVPINGANVYKEQHYNTYFPHISNHGFILDLSLKKYGSNLYLFFGGGGLGGEKLGKESNIEIYIFGGLGLGGWLWPSIFRDCPNTFKQVGMKSGCCCHLFVLAVAICRSQVCKKPPAFQSKLAKLKSLLPPVLFRP